ncbi:ATP-binding cassette domain-containing protein [Xanthobacter dioxanivorans]|uniref:ATP-binding cassette domain-containing protein n=1 Tax=Xanthobacter dioxanivorans TaxID=2528964 RepID=A0A974PRI4_9HYPH|nr:ABC transporter ATP-binding protein [Xanthobacter dioxanivorans]QRG08151.1 ATP-binding cassette domain-containing protein [Xanthobacter dioxanivorans]
MNGMEAPALEIDRVSHAFGKRLALDDVSLTVPAGRFVALLGPNGAGKTTLFSLATRLYTTRTGRLRIFGKDLASHPSAALAELGVVFQSRTLDLDLSVRQNLAYHAALHGLAGRAARARIAHLLGRVGLGERADEKVRTLSGGQARRVEIARALIHRPRLLLLDEATVGLDLASRADIVAIVRGLVAQEGLAVLWATHIFDEVQAEDEIYVLDKGRIIARGTAGEIIGGVAGPPSAPPAEGATASLEAAFRAMTSARSEDAA